MAQRSHHWAILAGTLLAIGACATPGFGQERAAVEAQAETVRAVPLAGVHTTNKPADSSELRHEVALFAAATAAGMNTDALRTARCRAAADLAVAQPGIEPADLTTYDALVANSRADVTYTVTDSPIPHTESWSYEDDTWRNDTC